MEGFITDWLNLALRWFHVIVAIAWIGDVSAVLLIAIRTYRLIFHPEEIHDAKIKTAE